MKRSILLVFLALYFGNSLLSQINGTGTSADPYWGSTDRNLVLDNSNSNFNSWQYDIWGNKVVYFCNNAHRNFVISSPYTVTLGAYIALSVQYSYSVLTINSGGTLNIKPGGYATTFGMVNNGNIKLESDQSGISALLIQWPYTYSGSGTAEENIFLTGGTAPTGGIRWHYISTPINGISTSVFTSNPTTLNLAKYIEILIHSDNSIGWIGYDGYDYSTGGSRPAYSFGSLELGIGYNYYCSTDATRTFSGPLNNSDVNVSLTCGTGYPDSQGYNLIGNPFPCVLDWDYISDYTLPLEVDNAIYFTIQDGFASYVNKVAAGGATDYGSIPPMQGFFVHVNTPSSGVTMTIPAGAKVVDPWQYRYKGESGLSENSSTKIPLVRLKIEDKNSVDDMVARFDPEATMVFDKKFDAYKFSKTSKSVGTWSKTGTIDYSINGLPLPETSVDIPIGVYSSSTGILKLSSSELKNLDGYAVTLKDLYTNITVNLKSGGIMVFNAPAGIVEDRFVLTVTNISTATPEITFPAKKFSVYSASGIINILSHSDELLNIPSSVTVYDLTGRRIKQLNNVEWTSNGELKQIQVDPKEKGLLLVEIKSGNKKYVEKVNLGR